MSGDENDNLYSACAVTRSMIKWSKVETDDVQSHHPIDSSRGTDLSDTFLFYLDGSSNVNTAIQQWVSTEESNTQVNQEQDTLSREKLLS
jgi:hypothetical protein